MIMSLNTLQHLLLDILSTQREVDPRALSKLDKNDWGQISTMIHQHRLGPLLYWRLKHNRPELPIPEDIIEKLSADYKQSTLHSLLMQREMINVHRILKKAAIPHTFLKGAFLAFYSYPNPGLRPMRDIDLLVPEVDAMMAFKTLCDAGLIRFKQYQGSSEAAMQITKHLPPLLTPSGRAMIELHTKLFSPQGSADKHPDLSREPHLWQRLIHQNMAGVSIPFLSTADQLLHLIVHCAYDHQFNNGPLIFSDVVYLLEHQTIDWSLFWQLAQYTGRTHGCLLLLEMVEQYFGKQPIVWRELEQEEITVPQRLIETASLLTLSDFDRGTVQFGVEIATQQTLADKIGIILKRTFPSKKRIAAQFPTSEDSPLIYLWYIAKWYRLVVKRLPENFRVKRSKQGQDELKDLVACRQWLKGKEIE